MGDTRFGVGSWGGAPSYMPSSTQDDTGDDPTAPVAGSNGAAVVDGAATASLSSYERFLIGLNDATARLLAGATIGDVDILDALRLLGTAAGVERIHLYRHVPGATDLGHASQEYEWVSDPAHSLAARPELRKIPWDRQGEPIRAKLVAGEAVFMRVDRMPDETSRVPTQMGNKSTLLIPVETRGKLWGHVALNSLESVREWSQAEVAALSTVTNAFGSAIDRMHLERQLAESLAENIVRSQRAEDRFRLLTESMKDVLWVYDIGLAKFTYASPSVQMVTGFTPAEVRELAFDQAVATSYRDIARDFISRHHAKLLESGLPQGEYMTIELDLCRKGGDKVPVEAVVRFQRDALSGRVEMVGAARDISDRKRIQQALAESEEHYRLLAENSMDVVLRLERDSTVQWVSPSLLDALGWLPQDWIGAKISDYLHPDDRDCFEGARHRVVEGKPTVARFRIREVGGAYRWVEVHAKRYTVAERSEVGAVATFRVVDAEVKTEHELERRARFDELTDVFNRHEIFEHLGALNGELARTGSQSAIMYVDVDNLKEVNDMQGHCTGDVLLQAVAARVKSALRSSDVMGRIGGDEFLVLLRGVHGEDDAIAVAEKVREAVAVQLMTSAGMLVPSVSVGVAICSGDQDPDLLVARADDALRHAKGIGRNQVVII